MFALFEKGTIFAALLKMLVVVGENSCLKSLPGSIGQILKE